MRNLFTILTILLVAFSCDPSADPSSVGSGHALFWTRDTLAVNCPVDIGSYHFATLNPDFAFLVGHDYTSKGVLFHYDGFKWANFTTGIDSFVVADLYVHSPDRLVAVGYSPAGQGHVFLSIDGIWNRIALPDSLPRLLSIAYRAPVGYAIGGYDRTLITLSEDFQQMRLVSHVKGTGHIEKIAFRSPNEIVYLVDYFNQPDHPYHDAHFIANNLVTGSTPATTALTFPGPPHHRRALWTEEDGQAYVGFASFGSADSGVVIPVYPPSSNHTTYYLSGEVLDLCGSSSQNLYAATDGYLIRFNGSAWTQNLSLPSSLTYTSVWTNGNEVFVAGIPREGSQDRVILFRLS